MNVTYKSETKIELTAEQVSNIWNKISLGDPVGLSPVWENKQETLQTLWEAFAQGIDKYIEKFEIPTEKNAGESIREFMLRVLMEMRQARPGMQNPSECENPRVAVELGGGGYNCVLGTQILARVCERVGIEVYCGVPYGHAVAVVREENNGYLFVDTANGDIATLQTFRSNADVGNITMLVMDEMLYGRELSPYELVPVITVQQSVALTIANLQIYTEETSKKSDFAAKVIDYLQLADNVPYGSAKIMFTPELIELRGKNRWKEERDAVTRKREYLQKTLVDNIDKITN